MNEAQGFVRIKVEEIHGTSDLLLKSDHIISIDYQSSLTSPTLTIRTTGKNYEFQGSAAMAIYSHYDEILESAAAGRFFKIWVKKGVRP